MADPKLMAIGVSLGNAVRSLTIDSDLAAHLVPAQVVRASNWEFITRDYLRPMLTNIEKLFGDPVARRLSVIRDAVGNAHM
jgi:hypothetical protein